MIDSGAAIARQARRVLTQREWLAGAGSIAVNRARSLMPMRCGVAAIQSVWPCGSGDSRHAGRGLWRARHDPAIASRISVSKESLIALLVWFVLQYRSFPLATLPIPRSTGRTRVV